MRGAIPLLMLLLACAAGAVPLVTVRSAMEDVEASFARTREAWVPEVASGPILFPAPWNLDAVRATDLRQGSPILEFAARQTLYTSLWTPSFLDESHAHVLDPIGS